MAFSSHVTHINESVDVRNMNELFYLTHINESRRGIKTPSYINESHKISEMRHTHINQSYTHA